MIESSKKLWLTLVLGVSLFSFITYVVKKQL